jgi:DNA-binding transcriptional ArsR family regulator
VERVSTADLLLHPVRLRIVKAFLGDRALTTSQLRADLDDVPAASLYRHVARLVDAGVLSVVAERRVRGAVERTYVLRLMAAQVGIDELEKMGPDDHRQMFITLVAGLLGDFDQYLALGHVDPLRDGTMFRVAGLWLDDAEFTEFALDMARVLQPRMANPPKPGRKLRLLTQVLLPGGEAGADGDSAAAKPGPEA